MALYLVEVRKMQRYFRDFEVRYIPRRDNSLADHLSKVGSSQIPVPTGVLVKHLYKPSIPSAEEAPEMSGNVSLLEHGANWMMPFIQYLAHGTLPKEEAERYWFIRRSSPYKLIDDALYRKGTLGVLSKCISQEEGKFLLRHIHEGICGAHSSFRTLVSKAFQLGYYWPTALADARSIVTTCRAC